MINQCSACLDQIQTNQRQQTADLTALHGCRTEKIADAHQKAAQRHDCDRQHNRLAEFLQEFHDEYLRNAHLRTTIVSLIRLYNGFFKRMTHCEIPPMKEKSRRSF